MSEARQAEDRARELKRLHNLREEVAYTAAWSELGYSFSGIAKKVDVTEDTVKHRIEQLEERFGWGCCMVKPEEERQGPLSGRRDPRKCANLACQKRSVVSVEFARDIFPSPKKEFKLALESAEATGEPYICTSCYETWVAQDTEGTDKPDHPDVLPRLRKEASWIGFNSDKRPCAPWTTGGMESVDAHNFYNQTSFATAWEWRSKLPGMGVGVSLSPQDPFTVIDLDDVRDPETGEIEEWARDLIERVDTYTEVSPSGTGVHLVAIGTPPSNVVKEAKGFEMYTRSQYVTVTFDHIEGTPTEAKERNHTLGEIHSEFGGEHPTVADLATFDGEAPDSPLYSMPIPEVFTDTRPGENVSHPIHGSTTGDNFRVDADRHTKWRCWRHRVSGNVSQLLAMAYLVAEEGVPPESIECGDVARRFKTDDELLTKTWAWAVAEETIPPDDIPSRVVPTELPE